MTPEQFCYWLQGYSEISDESPTGDQWTIIQDHLKLVFEKVTPDRPNEPTYCSGFTFPPKKYYIDTPLPLEEGVIHTC